MENFQDTAVTHFHILAKFVSVAEEEMCDPQVPFLHLLGSELLRAVGTDLTLWI